MKKNSIKHKSSSPTETNRPILPIPLYIQRVLLPDRQTLRGDSRHQDKHY